MITFTTHGSIEKIQTLAGSRKKMKYIVLVEILKNYYCKLGKSRPAIYCSPILYSSTHILLLSIEKCSDYSTLNHRSKTKEINILNRYLRVLLTNITTL